MAKLDFRNKIFIRHLNVEPNKVLQYFMMSLC